MEFDNVVYVHPICLMCGNAEVEASTMMRAKATLTMSGYPVNMRSHREKKKGIWPIFYPCQCLKWRDFHVRVKNFANSNWNDDNIHGWELKPGITDEELPEDVKNILQKASRVRNRLEQAKGTLKGLVEVWKQYGIEMVVTPGHQVKYLRGWSSKALKKNEEGPVQGKKSERVRENCEVEETPLSPESPNGSENAEENDEEHE